ncbi:hypothetical protein ABF87_09225 [Nitrosomonas sp. JL21]|uniref:hypothetical protein n=1 Tax=Nitrosomonas sp. JL21 TaxID=153949 RepID=UPI001370DE63|nr:hypothetical protein [Nitrosomonas sp. JL21]MBL8496791.1 hypothetical protein [Nitrosomonas sp.]MBL8498457.1 hypothetical protein [Nitrosomonas sp.]MXS78135.1 hypothetical protein [Nitrosomonas sp. JL21]
MVKPTDAELLVSGGLTNIFFHCDTCLSDDDFNRLRHLEFLDKENQLLQGQLSGSIAGVIERGSIASSNKSKQEETRRTKEREMAQFIKLVEQIRASIERMEADIRILKASFEKRDGDAWREKLALRILEADAIPQQEADEKIETYRKRLERHLINEMLNPDGTIKDKYKNDLKHGDYAEWAQKQFHLNSAKAAVAELDDDNTSLQRKEQILDEMKQRGFVQEMVFADRVSENMSTQKSVRDARDNQRDTALSQRESFSGVIKFTS